MSLARLVITAVYVEGRNKSEVAREYRVSRRWVQKLTARYEAEGEAAFEPRSRRPRTSPRRVSRELEDQIVALRKTLAEEGLDAGAATIAVHLTRLHGSAPAVSTIWRVLTRRGFVTPQPRKRPKASYTRFAADQPNERWQLDITHWQLAGGAARRDPQHHRRPLPAADRLGRPADLQGRRRGHRVPPGRQPARPARLDAVR